MSSVAPGRLLLAAVAFWVALAVAAVAVPALWALAAGVAERARTSGRFGLRSSEFEARAFRPGFFQGLSGIGYQLLRTAAPNRLPSVLGFQTAPREDSGEV